MEKQVVDASALLAVLLGEPQVNAVREASQGTDFIAPGSLPWEIGNALVVNVRKDRLTVDQAETAQQRFEQIPIRQVPTERHTALRITAEEGIYAYDAYMLACAEQYRAPLLVLDLRLRAIAHQRDVHVIPEQVEGDERYS